MRRLWCLAALCGVLGACSRDAARFPDPELADAQAQAEESAAGFQTTSLAACGLLSRDEVQAAMGPLAGPPTTPPEDAQDTAQGRCVWRGEDGRALALAASDEGGAERLAAIEPYAVVGVMGDWQEARLQGCCLLHAVKDEAMVSLDFSSARIELAQAARLMDRALARVHEPLDTD
jgi:hypothetical protein